MDWTQVMTIIGANMALFLWSVRQSRTDFLHTCRIIEAIQNEMKSFHEKSESKANQKQILKKGQ